MRGLPLVLGCSTTQVAECSSLGGLRLAFRGKLATPREGSQGFVGGRQSWHWLVLRAANKDPKLRSGQVALGVKPRGRLSPTAESYSGLKRQLSNRARRGKLGSGLALTTLLYVRTAWQGRELFQLHLRETEKRVS